MTDSQIITSESVQNSTIVFLHGWGLNHAIWQPIATKLSEQFKVVCLDLPGFGLKANQSFEHYRFEDVANTLAEEIPEQSILVGWSLGGLIASQIALHHREKVSKLVTVSSSPYFVEESDWPGIRPLVLKSFHQQLSKNGQQTIEAFLKIQAMGSPHLRHDIKVIRELVMTLPQPSQQTLDLSLNLLETVDIRTNIANLRQPLLRLYGEMDSLVPKAAIEYIDKLAPNSESYTFTKASHAPFISHEKDFLNTLLTWLQAK